jgi:hypothetical protein
MSLDSPLLPPSEPPPNGIKIYNWPDLRDEERINPDTRLVRYMKLETFLLLLDSWVFIPTLKTFKMETALKRASPYVDCIL